MTKTEIEARLIQGWEWMKRNPNHSRLEEFFNDKFIPMMSIYESRHGFGVKGDAVKKLVLNEQDLPEPSPWIEELREQLTLGGIADVEPKREERLQS